VRSLDQDQELKVTLRGKVQMLSKELMNWTLEVGPWEDRKVNTSGAVKAHLRKKLEVWW
jgi:hypothetical protein